MEGDVTSLLGLVSIGALDSDSLGVLSREIFELDFESSGLITHNNLVAEVVDVLPLISLL